ncbi:MAG: DegV family protein [Blautia sp.]
MSYQLYTDATADFCPEMAAPYAQIRVIPMELTVGEEAHTYGPGGDLTVKAFYEELRNGKYASTSQINPAIYEEAFRKTLEEGKDILYLCFSSGLSSTYQSAQIAVRDLEEDFPERKIICIDTLCGSVGEGFLVREAARLQSGGYSMENLADWVTAHRLDICHWFTVDMFDHLRHGGRVSAAAAAIGTVLQIKPMLHVSNDGKLEVVEKPRGQKKAMALQLDYMKKAGTRRSVRWFSSVTVTVRRRQSF